MNTRAPLAIVVLVALLPSRTVHAQITDPLPAPIDKKGLMVQIRDVVRLPKTLGLFHPDQDVNPAGWARVSFVHDLPDGRRFANDQRGYLYLLNEDASPSVYLDFVTAFPNTVYNRLQSGFVGFNPMSEPGDPDYGLLYTSGSDLGFSNGAGPNSENPGQTQRLDSVITAILRIDPRSPSESGGTAGLGDYTIPEIKPFAGDGDPETLGEIYAYGFRNAHRLSWDLTDGTMFAMDIGMNQIEEVNIVHAGGNYGWMAREGYWENGKYRPGGALNQLFELPADVLDGRTEDEYTYPVAFYDHNEGRAISGGFAYHGRIEALRGKFVFGDLVRGRLFAADLAAMKAADDGIPVTVAPIEEIQLYTLDANGNRVYVSFRELIERTNGAETIRADMHLGRSRDGEIFVTSRQDGMIRMLVPDGQ